MEAHNLNLIIMMIMSFTFVRLRKSERKKPPKLKKKKCYRMYDILEKKYI